MVAPTDCLHLQASRALLVSVVAAALDTGVLFLLNKHFGVPATIAAVFSYLLGGVLQYLLSSWWVFSRSLSNHTVGFTTFVILSLGGLAITTGAIGLVHDHLGQSLLLAKVIALGLAFWWNFLSRRYLLFNRGVGMPVKESAAAG